ncbi:hypothetical protein SSPO_023240 [Streptomyces antimycoticus]|uniref:Uncharacterized protein n=1 Tax=Streptomyces antimycoticus TaxID=68175 RepID=A0A499UST8_9ACTN|nr:hypothetical protein SSPO_023240 [Streptomyces antimycoticus]
MPLMRVAAVLAVPLGLLMLLVLVLGILLISVRVLLVPVGILGVRVLPVGALTVRILAVGLLRIGVLRVRLLSVGGLRIGILTGHRGLAAPLPVPVQRILGMPRLGAGSPAVLSHRSPSDGGGHRSACSWHGWRRPCRAERYRTAIR